MKRMPFTPLGKVAVFIIILIIAIVVLYTIRCKPAVTPRPAVKHTYGVNGKVCDNGVWYDRFTATLEDGRILHGASIILGADRLPLRCKSRGELYGMF